MKKHSLLHVKTIVFFLTGLLPAILEAQARLPLPAYDQRLPIVFWGKTGVTSQEGIQYLRDSGFITAGEAKAVEYCKFCDSTIFSIPSINFKVDGQQETVSAKDKPLGGPSGELGPLYYSVNFKFSTPEDAYRSEAFSPAGPVGIIPLLSGGNPVLVGVLDTGLDPAIAKSYAGNGFTSCMPGGEQGWNFADKTANIADDYTNFEGKLVTHGTPVTTLLFEQAAPKIPLKVLTVKVLNKQGQCSLFDVMCALAYAQQAGVKIINASLGFYATVNQVKGFEEYIKSITKKGVIIVAAAGNANDEEDQKAITASGLKEQFNSRDLDQHPFYPAAFSESNQRIISVTTLSFQNSRTKVVSPQQNFSPTKVQVGVYADLNSFGFIEPFTNNTRIGSSFAAPIVAGQIAAKYHELFSTRQFPTAFNRDALLQKVFGAASTSVTPGSTKVKLPLYKTTHQKIQAVK